MQVSSYSLLMHSKRFEPQQQCLEYLATLKWAAGFRYVKLKHTQSNTGNFKYKDICIECSDEHKQISGTIFHRLDNFIFD
jgi:hypothetical protein